MPILLKTNTVNSRSSSVVEWTVRHAFRSRRSVQTTPRHICSTHLRQQRTLDRSFSRRALYESAAPGLGFKHSELSADCIRLVHLLPGSFPSKIACRITTHYLQDAIPEYEALSYAWGPEIQHDIVCNGNIFSVRKNLFQALHALRKTDRERLLWIDAISIDQTNLDERASQVSLMTSIFSDASRVVIWLGEASQNTPQAFELLHQLSKARINASSVHPLRFKNPMSRNDMLSASIFEPSHPAWKGLDAIFWRSWFVRLWILQEVAVSKDAVVMCGTHEFNWKEMTKVARLIESRLLAAHTRVDPVLPITLDACVVNINRKISSHLLSLLIRTRFSRVTDGRDKVYSLLGVASDTADLQIRPNYTLSTAQLYTNLAKRFIQRDGNLNILNCVEDQGLRSKVDLPSWVPDWEVDPLSMPFMQSHVLYGQSGVKFNAARSSKPDSDFTSDVDDRILIISGRGIDYIKHLGDIFQWSPPPTQSPLARYAHKADKLSSTGLGILDRGFRTHWSQWEEISKSVQSQTFANHGQNLEGTFIRTLIADKPVSHAPTSFASLREYYQAWASFWAKAGLHGSSSYPEALSNFTVKSESIPIDSANRPHWMDYMRAHLQAAYGRRFFVTAKGRMGLCPASTRAGDVLVLLRGGKTPYILRERRQEHWEFVGECCMHGVMYGEAWDDETPESHFRIA